MTRGPGARSKRARLTSPGPDSGRPCAMQSYAVGCVRISVVPARAARASTRRALLFHPSRFSERVAKRWGRLALEGRAPPTRRTIRTDAPGPPNPSVIPSGAPRASHDRRRTSSGPRAPRREVRPFPKLFPPAPRPPRPLIASFFQPSPPRPSPRARALPPDLIAPDPPSSRRETYSEACARPPPPRSRAARRGYLHRCDPTAPTFSPFESPPDARAGCAGGVPRLTLRPGAAAPRGRPRPPRRYPSHPRPLEPSPRGFDTLAPGLRNPARPTRGAARRRAR